MALGSTQPLTEMSTRSIFWGKGGRFLRLTTLPPSCAVVTKSGNFNFLEPPRPLRACNETALPLLIEEAVEIQPKVRGFYSISAWEHPVERCIMGYENLGAVHSISKFNGSHHEKCSESLLSAGCLLIYYFYSSTCYKHLIILIYVWWWVKHIWRTVSTEIWHHINWLEVSTRFVVTCYFRFSVKVKVKQTRYRPGVAQRVAGS